MTELLSSETQVTLADRFAQALADHFDAEIVRELCEIAQQQEDTTPMTEGYNSDEDRWATTPDTPIRERLWSAWNKLEDEMDKLLAVDAMAAERNELFKVVKEIRDTPPYESILGLSRPTITEPTVTAEEAAKHSVTESEVTELPRIRCYPEPDEARVAKEQGVHLSSLYDHGYLYDFFWHDGRVVVVSDSNYFDPEDAPHYFDKEEFLEEVLREVDERISEALWSENDARLAQKAADETW